MKITQMSALIVIFFISVLITYPAFSQRLDFRHYNVQDGLIQSQVSSILQDNEGFMWFTTIGGVSCFDGKNFKGYTKRNGLAENYVTCAFKDAKGRLWFGHEHGKITIYNPLTKKFKIIQITSDNKLIKKASIVNIYVEPSGRVWVSTFGAGIFYSAQQKFHRISKKKNKLLCNYIFSIIQRKNGDFWFASPFGVSILHTRMLSDSVKLDSLVFPGKSKPYILDLMNDSNNGVWIGTSDKDVYYYTSQGKFLHFDRKNGFSTKDVFEIYEMKNHDIWFLSYKNGAYRLSAQNWQKGKFKLEHISQKQGLASNDISELFEDSEGNIWLGYDGQGVDQLRSRSIEYFPLSKNGFSPIVWSIWGDKQTTWFGLENGLVRYNHKTKSYRYYKSLLGKPLSSILQIFHDKDGKLWFVSNGSGVFKYNPKNGRFSKFTFPKKFDERVIFSICQDNEGKFWFGSQYEGIEVYDPHKKSFKRYYRKTNKLISDSITVLYKSKAGDLWIGTVDAGLIKFNGKKFELFSPLTGFPIQNVTNITEDKQGNIWLITGDDELLMFDGKKVHDFTSTSGLNQSALFFIAFWRDELWIGTNRGVAHLDRHARSFIHFGNKEGFKISECNERAAFIGPDSNLWFGTIQGAVKINPYTLNEFNFVPKVKITDIKIFLKNAEFPEDHKLSFNKNHLTFFYTGLYFKVPEWVIYQYKLEGFDGKWSPPVKDRFATYSYLPSGSFTFKVRASIDGEHWSKSPAQFSFIITPPFYKTWWFISSAVMIILLLVFGAIRYRELQNRQIRRTLERKVTERTLALQKEKEEVEKAFKALNESEKKFRKYTESTSSGIYIHQDNRFKYVNNGAHKISEYSIDELYSMNIWRLVHPDDLEMLKERFRRRVAGDKNIPARYEFRIFTKSGKVKWLDFTGQIIEYERKPAVLATVFDITERKNAEQQLMAEKERLFATLSAIADGVIAVEKDQKIILCNKKARKMLEIVQQDFEKKRSVLSDLFKIVDEKEGNPLPNPIEELFGTEGNVQIERAGYLTNRSGRKLLIEYSAAPIKDKDSALIGAVIAFRDITGKRRMEMELLKSQKLESIGVLAGGIAHDFNNFLTAIMGNLSLMRMQVKENDKLIQRIQSAEKAANRAQELTQQLLTFSKGGAPIKKYTNLEELVRDSTDFVLSGSNVDYVLEVDSQLWGVEVDAGQISQVIQNLIINANQAMPNGGTIRIKLQNVSYQSDVSLPLKAGDYVRLVIEDSGIGIPKKYLSRIFDPFFTTKQSGSGLGLATSFSIISKHDGHIDVQSEIGKGTRFIIYLPASKKSKREKNKDNQVFAHKKIEKSGLVLVMDDEDMIREIATELLSQFGYLSIHASDGKQALALYKKLKEDGKHIDFVIMDLTIPGGMGGKEAITKLLKIDPEANVIVSSGYSNDPVMAQYKEYGFKGCLQKPFNMEEMGEVLKNLGFI